MKHFALLLSLFIASSTWAQNLPPANVATRPATQPATAPATHHADDWYALTLNGQRVGHAHITSKPVPQRQPPAVRTGVTVNMALKRGGQTIAVRQQLNVTEQPLGTLTHVTADLQAGAMSVRKTYAFDHHANTVTLTTTQFDQKLTTTKPLPPGDWLTPAQSSQYLQQQMTAGAEHIAYAMYFPGQSEAVTNIAHTRHQREIIETLGKSVPATRWTTTSSEMPGQQTTDHFGDDATLLKTSMSIMGMPLTMVKTTQALATLEADPPELMADTLIKPDKPIANPRALRQATYRLTLSPSNKPAPASPNPATTQTAPTFPRTLTLDLDAPPQPVPADFDTTPFLAATSMANHQDPEVRRLIAEANAIFLTQTAHRDMTHANATRYKANVIHRYVRDHIETKDLSVGMATASEVARTAVGDCTEHAVLLTAMLRGAGIPARSVAGLAYIDQFLGEQGVFGFHMWTQALLPIEGHPTRHAWVDLDAALPGQGPLGADAARIPLITSTLADAEPEPLLELVPLIGQLQIEMLPTP